MGFVFWRASHASHGWYSRREVGVSSFPFVMAILHAVLTLSRLGPCCTVCSLWERERERPDCWKLEERYSQRGACRQGLLPFKRWGWQQKGLFQTEEKRLRRCHRALWLWTLEHGRLGAPSPTSHCCVCVMLQLHYLCSCMWAEDGAAGWGGGLLRGTLLSEGNEVCHLVTMCRLEINGRLLKSEKVNVGWIFFSH